MQAEMNLLKLEIKHLNNQVLTLQQGLFNLQAVMLNTLMPSPDHVVSKELKKMIKHLEECDR